MADRIDLALLPKQAHWNLKGREFIAVHEMLDGFRDQVDAVFDTIAERVMPLGGTAPGSTPTTAKAGTLPSYPTDIYAIPDLSRALIERYGKAANNIRKSIDQADEAGDADTADLFIEVSRGLDKASWFLEAHVQE